jgi:hypothetical protein
MRYLAIVVCAVILWGTGVAGEIEREIRSQGLVPYLEGLLSSERGLKAFMTPDTRTTMSEGIDKLRAGRVERLSVMSLNPSSLYEFDFVRADVGEEMFEIALQFGRVDGELRAFALSINTFPSNADAIIEDFWGILPQCEVPKTLVDSTARALEGTLRDGTRARFNQFEKALTAEVRKVPTCIQSRLARNEAGSQRRFLDSFQPRPKAGFITAKSLGKDGFCLAFSFETAVAPGVATVVFLLAEGKPLVGETGFYFGRSAYRFIPDMRPLKKAEETEPVGPAPMRVVKRGE